MSNRKSPTSLIVSAAMLAVPVVGTTQGRTVAITGVNVVDVIDGRIVPISTVVTPWIGSQLSAASSATGCSTR